MRLLIVTSWQSMVNNLHDHFGQKGHILDSTGCGNTGLALAAGTSYDAILIETGLSKLSGFELCNKLRTGLRLDTPVIMLGTRDSLADKAASFTSGADEYLVKPFSFAELDMRLAALVRRARGRYGNQRALSFGEIVFNPGIPHASREGIALPLTRSGYALLHMLVAAAPHIVPHQRLEYALWSGDKPASGSLRNHIAALRRIVDKPFAYAMIATAFGIGYRLTDEGRPANQD